MRRLDDRGCNIVIQTGDTDIEASLEEKALFGSTKIHFCIDRHLRRELVTELARCDPHRPLKAGGPARSEELFWIGAGTPGAWCR